jgi:hypothetical protein
MRHDEIKYVDELSDARGKFSVNTVLQFKKSLKSMPAGILACFPVLWASSVYYGPK